MATKRRKTRRKARSAAPKIVFANPTKRLRRRRAVKRNPAPATRRRRRAAPSFFQSIKRRARRVKSNPKGSVSVGSNFQDGAISVLSGGLGFFAGLAANKVFPASWVRFRGAVIAGLSLIAVWKVKEKHIRIGFIGAAIEGATDLLKQNVSAFSNLAADDASEHLLGAGSEIPQLGASSELGDDSETMLGYELGEESDAMSGSMFGDDELSGNSDW